MRLSPYEKTKSLLRSILYIIIGLIAFVLIKGCDRRKVHEITSEELKEKEQTAIIVDPSGKVKKITRRNGNGNSIRPPLLRGGKSQPKEEYGNTIETFDGARGIRFSVDKDGNVTATARYYGLCFEPGIGLTFTQTYGRLYIDSQVAFYRRHGINLGASLEMSNRKEGALSVAYSYWLPWKYTNNTSLLVGIDTRHEAFVGTRVRF